MIQLTRRGKVSAFIYVVSGLLFLTIAGFVASLFISHINVGMVATGLLPHISKGEELYVALGIIGSTIMPHAVHCHSTLISERHGKSDYLRQKKLLRWARIDVGITMAIAGLANLALLVVGAINVYPDSSGTTIEGSVRRISQLHGGAYGDLFALGLLASSLASSAIGGYAGSSVMKGLPRISINRKYRAILAILPAVIILSFTKNSTGVLIGSQVVLTCGLPFVLAPLIWFTSKNSVMGKLQSIQFLMMTSGSLFILLLGLNIFSLGAVF